MKKQIKKIIKKITPKKIIDLYKKNKVNKKRKTRLKIKLQPRNLLKFEVHLADHCNLNCIGCNHFSPLAEHIFLDIESFRRDCERISKLSERKIGELYLLGGEPLLHPYINEILNIVGQNFDTHNTGIVTNGVLLFKMTEDFWKCCKENKIKIIITRYPINLDFTAVEKIAGTYNVQLEYFGNTREITRFMDKIPLDLEGRQNAVKNFRLCGKSNNCITLKDGKLYTCSLAPHINHFNKYFNKNLQVSESDYIDIYKANSISEILLFLTKAIPFCRYCKIQGLTGGIKWAVTKKEISEWV